MDTEFTDDLQNEDPSEQVAEEKPKKKVKKSKSSGETKTKKTKTKKTVEKQSISVKSSFSKFDAIEKSSSRIHVRSSDASEAARTFSKESDGSGSKLCRKCNSQVFQMEQIKAERAVWHKSCFRCKECNKQLSIDTYGSHEGELYCKPHLRELFKPKTVEIEEEVNPFRRLKPKMIICENTPEELPPDVVRASEKPDLGLDELGGINIKSRFQVFESTTNGKDEEEESSGNKVFVKRSPSILSKLAKFQSKGMDVGVNDADFLNGIPIEDSDSESEGGDLNDESEEEAEENAEPTEPKKSKKKKVVPLVTKRLDDDMKNMWEQSQHERREEQKAQRKEEVQKLRSKLLMGKCGRIKEMYTQAVQESESQKPKSKAAEELEIINAQARALRERFERGEITNADDDEEDEDSAKRDKNDDLEAVEFGISKKSRSLFLEMDSASKQPLQPPPKLRTPTTPSKKITFVRNSIVENEDDVVKASDKIEDFEVQTETISSRFKFFEQYQQNQPDKPKKVFRITPPRDGVVKEDSPDRPIYRDEEIVRADERPMEEELVRSQTASRMLNLFRQMERDGSRDNIPAGPKPLKCFTPPPDYRPSNDSEDSEEEESEEEDEEEEEEDDEDRVPGVVRATDKIEDDFLKSASSAAHAKALRAKFEKWESTMANKENEDDDEKDDSNERESLESTSNLRAMFESMNTKQTTNQGVLTRERPRVNRFV
ncbi:LIM domain and actin-binding protein 1 isoform X2 [Neocloeon triangulifer]|nr:LIM domain and actin-binding protein 1 isoform X2 [Neocloeon triangulifer]